MMKKIVVIIMTAAIFAAGCSSPTSKEEVSEIPTGYIPRVHMACE
jgi:PBP1b-binding outer membrane lipoprotein LpoB